MEALHAIDWGRITIDVFTIEMEIRANVQAEATNKEIHEYMIKRGCASVENSTECAIECRIDTLCRYTEDRRIGNDAVYIHKDANLPQT